MKKISVLGLGIMGAGMAARLVKAGFDVTVWNRDARKAAPLVEAGAKVAPTPGDAARDADLVIAMLADDRASSAVWLGESGALAAMRQDTIAMECSTLTVEWVRRLAEQAHSRAVGFLDAPVTGSKVQANTGALSFLVGGPAETLERARPALEAMGSSIHHLGRSGSGSMMKLINNFLCGVQVASLGEAMVMAERAGLEVRQAAQVLSHGSPGSPLVKIVAQRMVDRDYTPNFFITLMAKDLEYAGETFARAGIVLKSAAVAREKFIAAAAQGHAENDIAAVVESLRQS